MKKLLFVICIFCASSFVQQDVIAQQPKTTASPETIEWQRVQSDNGEFSIELPKGCSYFYDKDGFTVVRPNLNYEYQLKNVRIVNCFQDQTLMDVEIYETKGAKDAVESFLNSSSDKSNMKKTKISDFSVREESMVFNDVYRNFRYITSKTHIYVLTTATLNKNSATSERFLASLRLSSAKSLIDNIVKISSLKTRTVEINVEQTDKNTANIEPKSDDDKSQKPLTIVSKPRPIYTEKARQNNVQGTIRLRLTFDTNGNISKIGIIDGLKDGLLRQAVFAALRIKFLPMEKDDKPISVTKIVEYGFNIY